MDGLISLLIIFGIFRILSSNKKKKQQQQRSAARQRAFRNAAEALQAGKKPQDDWKQFLSGLEGMAQERPLPGAEPAKPAAETARPRVYASPAPVNKPEAPKPVRKPVDIPLPKAASLLHLDNDEPEGTISTQGESTEEHALHRRKILAEEAALRETHQALQEVRSMNLKKLRTAVVMSEILGKPVSLRRR